MGRNAICFSFIKSHRVTSVIIFCSSPMHLIHDKIELYSDSSFIFIFGRRISHLNMLFYGANTPQLWFCPEQAVFASAAF